MVAIRFKLADTKSRAQDLLKMDIEKSKSLKDGVHHRYSLPCSGRVAVSVDGAERGE